MTSETLLIAFSLVLIFEGLGPALFPTKWRSYIQELAQQSDSNIRKIGIILIIIGWFLFLIFTS